MDQNSSPVTRYTAKTLGIDVRLAFFLVSAAVGIICILIAVVLNLTHGAWGDYSIAQSVIEKLLEVLGAAILALGVITFSMDTESWREYFSARLRDLILDHSYVKQLNNDQLKRLHRETTKALYSAPAVDENGLQVFVENHMLSLLKGRYRENYILNIHLEEVRDDGFVINFSSQYVIRQGSEKLNDLVKFRFPSSETKSIISFSIKCRHPEQEESVSLYKMPEDKILEANALIREKDHVVEAKIPPQHLIDQVEIIVEAEYVTNLGCIQKFESLIPTNVLTVMLASNVPSHIPTITPFFTNNGKCNHTPMKTGVRLSYNDWILPGCGVVWNFTPTSTSKQVVDLLNKQAAPDLAGRTAETQQPDIDADGHQRKITNTPPTRPNALE